MTEVLIVGSTPELDPRAPIWGTGGWRPPEEREALDWLTLIRTLGWGIRTAATVTQAARPDVAIVAAHVDTREGEDVLLRWAGAGTLVVGPHDHLPSRLKTAVEPGPSRPATSAGRIAWEGSDPRMTPFPGSIALIPSGPTQAWMTIDDRPAVVVRPEGDGRIAILGFHPSSARDASSTISTALVELLTTNAPVPTAWLDHSGTVVLRMDDPGGAQNVYSKQWCYRKLGSAEWRSVGESLARKDASLSVAYSAGFVDDGDASRGRLLIGSKDVAREAGRIHPSPLVRYEDVRGHAPGTSHDYQAEYEGISELIRGGTATVELHGYTHLHPDLATWKDAGDRYDSISWYREIGVAAAPFLAGLPLEAHPLSLGRDAIRTWFGLAPTTLICPGEEWTDDALRVALEIGVSLVGSYYLGVRYEDRLCWSTHICSPYLDEPDPSWFEAPLPVVGYMHDRDLVVNGLGWLDDCLEGWRQAGARRFTDYRDLAALIDSPLRVSSADDSWTIELGKPSLVPRPGFRVGVRTGDQRPVTLSVCGESFGTAPPGSGTRWIEAVRPSGVARS